jgi:putative flavoprotein involved in K+ transport
LRWQRRPSFQLTGRHAPALGLDTLARSGVRLVGRALAVRGKHVELGSDLSASVAAAEDALAHLLQRIEAFVHLWGLRPIMGAADPPPSVHVAPGPSSIDLRAEGIETVIWCTGFRRRYPWLRVPVVDARGEIAHEGGITRVPGLYVLGLRFLRRTSSSFIDGVGKDAFDLATRIEPAPTGRAAA